MRRRGRKTENQNDAEALARIRFRPCRVKDVTEGIGFWKEFGAAHSLKDEPAAVRRRLKRDRRLFLLAWDGGRLVGTIMAGWEGWRASMARLAVDSQYLRIWSRGGAPAWPDSRSIRSIGELGSRGRWSSASSGSFAVSVRDGSARSC